MNVQVINTQKWIEENKASFVPPVCNKLMHNEQLVIMFVGGPNNREDYHIEEGEELFYQIKGDMCVKILENGQHKDIHIKEGEFFLLPGRIPHSPQRTANSIGLVIERRRDLNETDGVRWFVPNTSDPLYEKWFYCKDLGSELVPLIKKYFASTEYQTKVPQDNVMDKKDLPFELSQTLIDKEKHGAYNLMEMISNSKKKSLNLTPSELNLQFSVEILQEGEFKCEVNETLDTWLWQLRGSSLLEIGDESSQLSSHDSVLIPAGSCSQFGVKLNSEESEPSLLMKVTQDPRRK